MKFQMEEMQKAQSRVSVWSNDLWIDVLDEIERNVGCQSVASKPTLRYRFLRTKNASILKLANEREWEEFKIDYRSTLKAKKADTMLIAEIILPEGVSHLLM